MVLFHILTNSYYYLFYYSHSSGCEVISLCGFDLHFQTEDKMVGWHHWLNGHEFEQALGVGDGQGSVACCSPWGHKESDMIEQLNWTNNFKYFPHVCWTFMYLLWKKGLFRSFSHPLIVFYCWVVTFFIYSRESLRYMIFIMSELVWNLGKLADFLGKKYQSWNSLRC